MYYKYDEMKVKFFFELQHVCVARERLQWDPKGGELFLGRVNAGETLREARTNTDVQIVLRIWE